VELDDLLALSFLCSSAVTMPLIDIISLTISSSAGKHAAHIVGHCMEVVAQREPAEWADKINLGFWTRKCVEKWHSSPKVLEGLYALAQAKLVLFLRILSSTLLNVFPVLR